MHDCLHFTHLKLVNGSSLWTSSQMFTYCCTASEVWFTVMIQATLWLRRTQEKKKKVFKTGDVQMKKAEFLTACKAFKTIFWPASVFGDFTVWIHNTTLQGDGGGGRERERERQTERQTDRQTDRLTETETETKNGRQCQKHIGIYRYINESSSI